MKIIFLSFYNGLVDRGVETFVSQLASRLVKKHKIIVFQAGSATGKEKYQVIQIPSNLSIAAFTLKALIKIYQLKPDFVYPLNGRWQALFCRLATLFSKSKLVIGGHAGIGRDDLFNLWLWPDVFIALSKKGKTWAKKWAPHVEITVIPHGVDLKKFNANVKPVKIDLQKPIILTVAGKEKFKRVDLVIRAISRLRRGGLLIVGQQSKSIISLGKKLLGEKKFKVACFSHSKMPQVYKAASLFTLVSDSREAFALSYLEAMACNLPVVVTDDSLRREIIGKAGFFVDPTNMKKYSQALKKALEENWGDLPRRQAERFSWEKVSKQYESLFEDLYKKS